jgi:hypothetical protein
MLTTSFAHAAATFQATVVAQKRAIGLTSMMPSRQVTVYDSYHGRGNDNLSVAVDLVDWDLIPDRADPN